MIKKVINKETSEKGQSIQISSSNFDTSWNFIKEVNSLFGNKEQFKFIHPRMEGYFVVRTGDRMFLMTPVAFEELYDIEE